MNRSFLRLTDISKSYPGVVALDDISLAFGSGEIIGLVGENGAGKSTLMKILGGVIAPSSGTIEIDDVAYQSLDVSQSIASGIAFVHQELNLFDNLDVAANVFMGREPLRAGPLRLIDRQALYTQTKRLLDILGVDFKPDTPVAALSIAQRQLLEIAKALSLNARFVILDEPTSSLTLAETERLTGILKDLKAQGVSIVFITHRLNELVACADKVIVLRDGRVVGELEKAAITPAAMINLMVGRDLKSLYLPPAGPSAGVAMEIVEVRTKTFPASTVSLAVRHGEILGLAGLMGSGRSELARAIFGIDSLIAGRICLDGVELLSRTPRGAISSGIFLVPEDRKRSGVILDFSISENIVLPNLSHYSKFGFLSRSHISRNAKVQAGRLNIRAPNVDTDVASLSGGNQQKVVLAKWLSLGPKVLICDEPTRGIDVGSKQEIYAILRALADSGVAVLMISSDMEEVIGVSDRIAVMREGRISGFLERQQFNEHNVLQLAVHENTH